MLMMTCHVLIRLTPECYMTLLFVTTYYLLQLFTFDTATFLLEKIKSKASQTNFSLYSAVELGDMFRQASARPPIFLLDALLAHFTHFLCRPTEPHASVNYFIYFSWAEKKKVYSSFMNYRRVQLRRRQDLTIEVAILVITTITTHDEK